MNLKLFARNEKIIDYLINCGANVNDASYLGIPILSYACNIGNISIVKKLVKSGANINQESRKGLYPIHFAAEINPFIVDYLVECGADINQMSRDGATPLHHYLVGKCSDKQGFNEHFFWKGANINARDIKASYEFITQELQANKECFGTKRIDHINEISFFSILFRHFYSHE